MVLPSKSQSVMLLATTLGLVRLASAFAPFTQPIKITSPGVDAMQELLDEEWHACSLNPGRFPACRHWRQRAREFTLADKVRSYRDRTYTISVLYGNPAEAFDVDIDTGSRAFWLAGPECTSDGCDTTAETKHPRKKFNYSSSTSFHTQFVDYNLTYAEGVLVVKGFLGKDTLNVGPVKINGQDVVVARHLDEGFKTFSSDGIIGLSFPREKEEEPRSALENMQEEIQMFSIFLRRNQAEETADGGAITWGSLDNVNCASDVHFIDVTHLDDNKTNLHHLWSFEMTSFKFADETYGEDEQWVAAVDTGASIIKGPEEAIKAFMDRNGAGWDEDLKAYKAPCDSPFINMTFVIGGRDYTIMPSQYVMKIPKLLDCYLTFDAQGGELGQPDWLIGTPFLRSFCNVFDVSQKRLGFAVHAV